MTLEASATTYAEDATYGHKIKSGDATRSLVGCWLCAGVANTWASLLCCGCSWFNPRLKADTAGVSNASTTSNTAIEFAGAIRTPWISFIGRNVQFVLSSYSVQGSVATADEYTGIGGTEGVLNRMGGAYTTNRNSAVGGSEQDPLTIIVNRVCAAEGYHHATPVGYASSTNTGTWGGIGVEVTIWG
jgi:hypothetical protein